MKYRKIILLINFIFAQTYFLIASSQILKNYAILINHGSFFLEKDSLQHDCFLFFKLNQLLSNTAICYRAEVSDVYSDENFFFHLRTDYVKSLIKIGLREQSYVSKCNILLKKSKTNQKFVDFKLDGKFSL